MKSLSQKVAVVFTCSLLCFISTYLFSQSPVFAYTPSDSALAVNSESITAADYENTTLHVSTLRFEGQLKLTLTGNLNAKKLSYRISVADVDGNTLKETVVKVKDITTISKYELGIEEGTYILTIASLDDTIIRQKVRF